MAQYPNITLTGEHALQGLYDSIGKDATDNELAAMQAAIDGLVKNPQFVQYVDQAKLGTMDDRFIRFDMLLKIGLLSVKGKQASAAISHQLGF